MTALRNRPSPEEIAEELRRRRAEWLPRVFPAGVERGGMFYLGDADGAAGDSLPIPVKPNGKAGIKDFAGGFKGDDLALFGRGMGHGDDQAAAYRAALEWLGYADRRPDRPDRRKAEPEQHGRSGSDRAYFTASWTYLDEKGEPWLDVARFDPPNGRKFYRQFNHRQKLWTGKEGGTLPEPRPLFNLPDLLGRAGERVVMVAGEKCAEELGELGYLTTTILGGEQSAHQADMAPLAGRAIVLWRDNDDAGLKWQAEVGKLLRGAGCFVLCVRIPESAPEKWDVADALADGTTSEEIARLIETAEPLATTLVCVSGMEFLEMPLPERERLFGPIVTRQGLVMLYAERGIGKTWISLGIAWACATGGTFLKWRAEKPVRVLYLDGEMPASLLQERLRDFHNSPQCRRLDTALGLRIVTPDLQIRAMPDLSSEEGRAQLDEILPGTDIVIVDNLSTLVRGGVENEAESWGPVQEWALGIRKRGMSVLFVHHAGKSGKQRGTSKREDVLDTVAMLRHPEGYEPDEGARVELHFEKTRGFAGPDAEAIEAWMERDRDGLMSWHWKPLVAEKRERVSTLATQGLSERAIAKELGIPKTTVHRWMARKDFE